MAQHSNQIYKFNFKVVVLDHEPCAIVNMHMEQLVAKKFKTMELSARSLLQTLPKKHQPH